MKLNKNTKDSLIKQLKDLEVEIGNVPLKKQWIDASSTPSDMPIRMLFGNWTNFLKEAGYKPRKSEFTIKARLNSIKARTGKLGGNNKGGKFVDKNGYVQIWMPDHPNARIAGYIHEHRLVMSKLLNRPLESTESVHHKNGDRQDNRVENLELWSSMQPSGQRVSDKLKYAYEIIEKYGNIHTNPELLNNNQNN